MFIRESKLLSNTFQMANVDSIFARHAVLNTYQLNHSGFLKAVHQLANQVYVGPKQTLAKPREPFTEQQPVGQNVLVLLFLEYLIQAKSTQVIWSEVSFAIDLTISILSCTFTNGNGNE